MAESHKKSIGDSNRDKQMTPVDMLDLQGNYIRSFNGIKEAGKFVGIWPTGINNCISGRTPTAGSYKWRYKIEENGKD